MVSVHTPAYQAFVAILKNRREELGISQRAFAQQMGVSQSYISKVETCELRLDIVDYFNFASNLEIDITVILKVLGNHISYYKNK